MENKLYICIVIKVNNTQNFTIMITIGFASEYYTLWDIQTETVYFTDNYGKHWPLREITKFLYLKNISKDLNKVKELYPTTLIDENLRGYNRSFSIDGKVDLSPEIIKFGKYSGLHIEEIAKKDFQYLLWLLENTNSAIIEKIKLLPEYIEYKNIQIANKQNKINSYLLIQSGNNVVTFNTNPNFKLKESYGYFNELKDYADYYCATSIIEDNNILYILFKEVKYVSGMYPYNMGFIKGKPMKIKNKSLDITLNVIFQYKNEHKCLQFAIIE